MKNKNWIVYIIHFNEPYKHAKHYTGITNDFYLRMKAHLKGKGAKLPYIVLKSGIGMKFFIWKNNLNFKEAKKEEKRIKKVIKNTARICKYCKQKKYFS